ncbi:MAG TPA: energy transducer TonB [Candidatus Eisenbacteria bacterium]|nr:energy transducer TonB [Candidatus Eisenbacteria bacterium]
MPAAVLAAVVALGAAGVAAGAAASAAPSPPAPDSAAAADIQAAYLQLLARRQLDVARFAGLLADAHRLSPALDPRAAAEWRQAAILLVGLVPRDSCSRFVDAAVALDPGLALDDTLGAIADLLGGPPPGMRAQLALRGAKAAGGQVSSMASRKPFPEGALRPSDSPNLSPNVRRADPVFFPRLLQTGAVADPRGPNARYQVVMVSAVIGADGRIREVKDAFGMDSLKAAAKAAVGGWRFAPMTVYGHPVEATTGIPVEFGKPPPPPSPPPPPPAARRRGERQCTTQPRRVRVRRGASRGHPPRAGAVPGPGERGRRGRDRPAPGAGGLHRPRRRRSRREIDPHARRRGRGRGPAVGLQAGH